MNKRFKDIMNDVRRDHMVRYYEDHVAYFYGKISATAGALVTYYISQEFIFLAATLAMLGIMLADVGNIRDYRKLATAKSRKFSSWEYHYTFLSTSFMLTLGIWCFFCFTVIDDPFIHMLCVAISMGNVLSLVCRNFSNDRILTLQLLAVAVPIVVGVMHYGDMRSVILSTFFLPLFASIRDISGRLRDLFSDAQQQSIAKQAYAEKLDSALENMSHGLIMLDGDRNVEVVNYAARQILGIHNDTRCGGHTLEEIAQFVDLDGPAANKVQLMSEALTERIRCRSGDRIFRLSEEQYVEITMQLREEGGCVIVIEEVSERIRFQTQINHLARFDELTGLYNRSFFLHRAKEEFSKRGENNGAAILFFDLDDFKRVNDTLGHEAGDFILTQVAERLNNLLPESAFAGRYGGDEFVIFVETANCPGGVDGLARAIIEQMPADMEFNKQMLRVGVSVGVAQYPKDGVSVDRLLKFADLALYEAKETGKNQYRHFSADLEDSLKRRVALEEDLACAVDKGHLELHFQPLVELKTGKTRVFEALTRWRRNGGEMVSPAEFIPIAEDLGLIREIGEWTLLEACRQCRNWPEDVSVAVNLSVVQFQVSSVIDSIRNALETSGLEPHRLEVEITESAVLNDITHAAELLDELHTMGVSVSLDDFGTGYSSLSYLHKLPLDKLKIDKTFVDDLEHSERSRTLLSGITALGKALKLKVVVEGVESEQQLQLLEKNYDVDFIQGYYFSKPLPAAESIAYKASEEERLAVSKGQKDKVIAA